MDHNAIKRRRYSNMLEEKKDELLRRRREAYARKKATTVQSTDTFKCSSIAEEKRNKSVLSAAKKNKESCI